MLVASSPHPSPLHHGNNSKPPATRPAIVKIPTKPRPAIVKIPTKPRPAIVKIPTKPHPQDPILNFHRLLSDGTLLLNHHTFPSLFRACCKLSAPFEAKQLHSQAIRRGYHYHVFVQRSLIRMYTNSLACQDALKLLDRCPDPDVIAQNDLMGGFLRTGDLVSARQLFDIMSYRNVVSWTVMMDGYACSGSMEIAQKLFDAMPERNQYAWSSLISGYLRCGQVEVARMVFDKMVPDRSVVTWTAMISGYVRNGYFKEAMDLFLDMQSAGVAPNAVTIVSILPAVAQLGALTQGQWIHAYLDKMGVEVDSILGSALVDMYAKCGCIEQAITIFQKLKHRTLSAWNSIILGLAAHGRGRDALRIFSRLQEDTILAPNEITFIGVLSACSHAGLVDEGLALFGLFTDYYKLTPNIRHYGCVVDLLGRAGFVEEALELVRKMPTEPNTVIWKTLLSACKIHKNIKLADEICRKITDMAPLDSGLFLLMSNIYYEMGRCNDAGALRREMNDLQMQKVAGCSWVEVDGVVHEFLMGRESFHSKSKQILCALYEMEGLMKLEYQDVGCPN